MELHYSYIVEDRLEAVYDKQELLMAAAYDGESYNSNILSQILLCGNSYVYYRGQLSRENKSTGLNQFSKIGSIIIYREERLE